MLVRALYTLILTLAAPLLLFGLYKSKPNKPKFGQRWKEHFGRTPALDCKERPIWIHAVSVGESIAATPLIKALKQQHPDQPILVTTTTSTGAEQIAKLGDLIEHRYMPIDFAFAVRGFLKVINPSKMLIIETELWPNTLNVVNKANVPIYVVNARLSEKSCNNYAKVQSLFNVIEPCLTKVLCQNQTDADRFESLGVSKEKLTVTGSIKFDIQISDEVRENGKKLRTKLGAHRPVWIAASTHQGEDEQVLAAHEQVLASHPNAILILVPRHPERFDAVFQLSQQLGFDTVRRTARLDVANSTQVYLADTMGEMLLLLGTADICFMGGSLIGDKVGGHNVLEPAALGVPTITGPSFFNFEDIVLTMKEEGIIDIAKNSQEIALHTTLYMSNKNQRNEVSSKLRTFTSKRCGALNSTIQKLNTINGQ
ncbi:3-deoxy-D-manno-octulosonic acid transferase [Vibrio owensii]|uniref:3-deoxy-D-manno-octulosonic acid transferase n=1 Tax=Vibrio owensii TaxID=696485 RepID=A0AAP9GEH8_9VIBR|nr:lipid IV(A) 3-deoxy-D-manno-octulosonic acid transferase [Vibrio owensii]AYO15886.1 3-deoxy-D-manno-octulosonic acid transferase [Vibrio owensii]QGH48509.1 3-deoxy-D-manno-octulosonic acid transferase [Vibrio owensii]